MIENRSADLKKAKIEYIAAVLLYGTIGLLVQFIKAESEFIVLCRGIIGTLTILCLCRSGAILLISRASGEIFCF